MQKLSRFSPCGGALCSVTSVTPREVQVTLAPPLPAGLTEGVVPKTHGKWHERHKLFGFLSRWSGGWLRCRHPENGRSAGAVRKRRRLSTSQPLQQRLPIPRPPDVTTLRLPAIVFGTGAQKRATERLVPVPRTLRHRRLPPRKDHPIVPTRRSAPASTTPRRSMSNRLLFVFLGALPEVCMSTASPQGSPFTRAVCLCPLRTAPEGQPSRLAINRQPPAVSRGLGGWVGGRFGAGARWNGKILAQQSRAKVCHGAFRHGIRRGVQYCFHPAAGDSKCSDIYGEFKHACNA